MSQTPDYIFKGLQVIAWIIFVALCIEAGAIIVNFVLSLYNPIVVKHLYQKLDLSAIYDRSKWAYYNMYSFIIAIAVLKAVMFYEVIKLLIKLDLSRPFNSFVSQKITSISYYTLSIGLVSYIGRQVAKGLHKKGFDTTNLNPFWEDSQAFILMSAVIYIIAVIFKKGIDLQNENDLTV